MTKCPKCKRSFTSKKIIIARNPTTYQCKNCGTMWNARRKLLLIDRM
jgi:uncharacterized Zn finger protein